MPSRTERARHTWNAIKHFFPKGPTLGSRQMSLLHAHIEYDWTRQSWSMGGTHRGVDESLLERGLLELWVAGTHPQGDFCTHIIWDHRITEKGLEEFIRNGGEKVGVSKDFRDKIKELLARTGWAEKDFWVEYLTIGYLP